MGVLLLQPDLFPDDLRAALLGSSWDHHPTQALEQNAPLYKYLARALLETPVPLIGSVFELLNTFKELMLCVKFRLHVQEPFFSQLKDGSKTVEGRCAVGAYNSFLPGDIVLFNDMLAQVVKVVNRYKSFEEMLEAEGLNAVLPGVMSVMEGVLIYRQFYTEEKERLGGVLAIHVQTLLEERQPMNIVRSILEEIGMYGLKALTSSIASLNSI